MSTSTSTYGTSPRRASSKADSVAAETQIGEGDKLVNVVLLNGERLGVRVHNVATGQHLFNRIVEYLELKEDHYFGLMIIKDGEQEFLNLEEKLSKLAKYAPHLWKDDMSCNSSLVFTIFFRVQFYVENICLLQQQATRHQYYLQLRKDVLEGGVYVHEETAMLLASYALQAEVGDYNANIHGVDYFLPEHYMPHRAIAKLTPVYIRHHLPTMHNQHRGLTDAQAEIEYLKEAQKLQEYGVLFNKVSKYKKDNKGGCSLGICVRGLIVYEERSTMKSPVFRQAWQNVKRMAFHRKRFYIEAHGYPEPSQIILYTSSYKKSRYLLELCTKFYNFHSKMGNKLSSMSKEFPKDSAVSLNDSLKSEQSDSPRQSPTSKRRLQNDFNPPTIIEPGDEMDKNETMRVENEIRRQKPYDPNSRQLNGNIVPINDISVFPVQLEKINGSFGLNIIGGVEDGGIFVKSIIENGAAALTGKIYVGDRILEINGVSLEGVSRQDAVAALRQAPRVSILVVQTAETNMAYNGEQINDMGAMTDSGVYSPDSRIRINENGIKEIAECFQVDLPKINGSFGVSVTGGVEMGGIFVKSLLPGGAAEANGRIAVGDKILEINGINLESYTRKQAVELLRGASSVASMVFERYMPIFDDAGQYVNSEEMLAMSPSYVLLEMDRGHMSLGLSLTGGPELGGIYVRSMNPSGIAAQDGRINIGDKIIAVNDICLINATRQQAIEALRNSPSRIKILVDKCIPDEAIFNVFPAENEQYGQYIPQYDQTDAPFEVLLYKGDTGIGMSLTGGGDRGPIMIKNLVPEGAAAQSGMLQIGDMLLQVNGKSLDRLTYKEALSILRNCPPEIHLLVQRPVMPLPLHYYESQTSLQGSYQTM